jgi:hypothetical protein
MQPSRNTEDRGAILPMVLVITVVLSAVVAAVASYATVGIRYGQIVEGRADRLAAADGGMRYAVGRLGQGDARLCGLGGDHVIDAPDINGATVEVTCTPVGAGFDNTNGWALILTGEGIPAGDAVMTTEGSASTTKLIEGPVYMNELTFGDSAPVEFQRGQMLYTAADCSVPSTIPAHVSFDSTSLGVSCTSRPWSRTTSGTVWSAEADPVTGLFSEPNIGVLPTNMLDGSVDYTDFTSDGTPCRAFQPGHYTVAPDLASNNYFMNGNYIFDGFTLPISNQTVTAGQTYNDSGVTPAGDDQFLPNTACSDLLPLDTPSGVLEAGVTFYMQNGASFELNGNGTLEVLRRKQGAAYVSLHVLDNSFAWNQPVIEQRPGTNKDMVMHGLVWAPEARVIFENVTNTADGQMLGGAVISNINIGSSSSGSGFLISVEPSDLHGKLQLESVAAANGGTTTIRSIVDYRPSTKFLAVTSWHVID